MSQNQNQGIKVNLADYPWETCSCGCYTFSSSVLFKKLPPLLSPSGKEECIPVEVMICDKCKKVPPFMAEKIPGLPDELKCPSITLINTLNE